jgi:hypothetical protein
VCASAIQIAAIALTTHPARITNGFEGGGRREIRRPFDVRRPVDRERRVLEVARRLRE